MLRAGIVGLPNVGKSTLFNAITRTRNAEAANYPFCTIDPNVGIVIGARRAAGRAEAHREDERGDSGRDRVRRHRRPGEGREHRAKGSGNKFLTHIREVDAVVQVVRCFDDADVHHVSGTIDPVRDIEVINTELMLADLEVVQKRRERLAKDAKRGDKGAVAEDAVLGKIEAALNDGQAGADGEAHAGGARAVGAVLPAVGQADDLRVQREGGAISPPPTRTRT